MHKERKPEGSCAIVQIEMYADPSGRGGVLEPEGMVEIKFRTPELIKAMHRLDPVLQRLKAEATPGSDAAVKAREAALLPVYRQVSHPPDLLLQGCITFVRYCLAITMSN